MDIIIAGDGKLGFALSERLSIEGHDVTVIDSKNEALKKSLEKLDVITIKGNVANVDVLKRAGVKEAEVIIAATSSDEVNMLCCFFAKKMGAKKTVARIRNPEYYDQMRERQDEMNINLVVNPELAAAIEIEKLINFPYAISILSVFNDELSLIEYKIEPDSDVVGKRIGVLGGKFANDISIGLVQRGQETFIARHDFIINANDHLFILGTSKNVMLFIRSICGCDRRIKSVMIVGGGLISYYLCEHLAEHGVHVKIIEQNEDTCEKLCEILPKALIICGDGTDKDLLDAEGMLDCDAFVALTNMDEENLIISMYASYRGVGKVITKINRLGFADVIRNAGIDCVVSPKQITANQIIRYVRNIDTNREQKVKTLFRVFGGEVEFLEFTVNAITKYLNIPIAKVRMHGDVSVVLIIRNGKPILPNCDDIISLYDKVIVATKLKDIDDLNDIIYI